LDAHARWIKTSSIRSATDPPTKCWPKLFNTLTPDEQRKSRGNLFIGLVVNEYLEDFHRGDFLIRNLLNADPHSGQHRRRRAAASRTDHAIPAARRRRGDGGHERTARQRQETNRRRDDLRRLPVQLQRPRSHLFGQPNHDDGQKVQQRFGPVGLAGFFCNGEIGPIGEKNFLHGFTASLALFVKK
jgi:small ligand-binding sensory domain FIST